MIGAERNAQPVERWGRGQFDFAALLHLLDLLRSAEQRLPGAQNIFDEATGGAGGRGSRLPLVDEIGEGEQLRLRIVNGDGKIARRHEFVDDAVDGGKELLQILSGAGFFGDGKESGIQSLGALAIGDIAIDEVVGCTAAVDDQGSGGERDIEQGSVAVATLSFEGKRFATLQTLCDPLRFRGAIWGKNQGVDGLGQSLRFAVAEEALKLPIDALRAKRSVDH